MAENHTREQTAPPVRRPSALWRWLVCGGLAGSFFAAANVLLLCLLVNHGEADIVVVAALVGALVGVIFGAWCWTGRPKECSLCTALAFMIGLLPGVLVLLGGPGAGVIKRPLTLVGILLVPAMIGLLIGGFLDRFVEPLLFSSPPEEHSAEVVTTGQPKTGQ
jgi:hypothetical protein